ncbi:hypothetical protein QFZ76_004700 [Streptomyces sp. V4I2]|nr:hypothetical protein [Streptomyces sp. V4I2]
MVQANPAYDARSLVAHRHMLELATAPDGTGPSMESLRVMAQELASDVLDADSGYRLLNEKAVAGGNLMEGAVPTTWPAPCRPCSAPPATARSTPSTSRSSARPTPPTRSSRPAPGAPITDLEHADGAYEWNWGTNELSTGKQVDQAVSKELRSQFAEYQAALKLRGLNGFGTLTARNYDEYLVKQYLEPSATTYLAGLSDSDRATHLAANTFLTWSGGKATFTWADFLTHVGARKKDAPAFDTFDLSAPENNEFGKDTTEARHFTAYGLKNDTTGVTGKRLDSDIPEMLNLMNPMYHLAKKNSGRSKHWWIRLGTKDSDTSLTVSANIAATATATATASPAQPGALRHRPHPSLLQP